MSQFDDFVVAHAAVSQLKEINQDSKNQKPFFMAVGFYRPHLPHAISTQFWSLFEEDLLANVSESGRVVISNPKYFNGPEPKSSMPARFAIDPDSRVHLGIPKVYHGVANFFFY